MLFSPVSDKAATADEVEDSFLEGNIIIAPNPTEGSVFINFINVNITRDIFTDLYDINGRHLRTLKVKSNRTEVKLLQDPSGTYILKLHSGTSSKEFVIIKK